MLFFTRIEYEYFLPGLSPLNSVESVWRGNSSTTSLSCRTSCHSSSAEPRSCGGSHRTPRRVFEICSTAGVSGVSGTDASVGSEYVGSLNGPSPTDDCADTRKRYSMPASRLVKHVAISTPRDCAAWRLFLASSFIFCMSLRRLRFIL